MHCFRKLTAVLLVAVVLAGTALADLQADIKQVLADRLLQKTTTGIEIVRLTEDPGKCQVMYERNARTPLLPASNMKLLTTSAALHILTPQFKYRTILVRRGDDLVVWGDGDPTLGDAEYMDEIGWAQTAVFEDWSNQLKKRQITTVRNIIIDDGIFDEEYLHPRWQKHQFNTYGAEIGGLNFGANIIEFTLNPSKKGTIVWTTKPVTEYVQVTTNTCSASGKKNAVYLDRTAGTNNFSIRGNLAGTGVYSSTIHDPGMYAGTVLKEMLQGRGITVTGVVSRDRTTRQQHATADPLTRDQEWQIVAVFETPLPSVVTRCNKESMNLYAESLSKRMGAAVLNSGSWESGATVIGGYLKKLGVAETEFHLDDGSGLSRENTVSPNAIIRCLLHNYYSPNRALFMDSLSIGGVDGTLKKFFHGDLQGRVFAKTGWISNASSLSGYVKTNSGEWYAFSILMNGVSDYTTSRNLQERIVEAIDDVAGQN